MNPTFRFFWAKVGFLCMAVALIFPTTFSGHASSTTNEINLTSPASGTTVSGWVTISAMSSKVVRANVYIDGGYLTSAPPYILDWNSNQVANGGHTISVVAYGRDDSPIGSSSVTVNVMNVTADVLNGWTANHLYAAGAIILPTANNPG